MNGTARPKKCETKKDRWTLTAFFGYDERGRQKKKQKTVTAKNQTEANRLLRKWLSDLEGCEYNTENQTIAQFLDYWLEHYPTIKKLSPRTLETYNDAAARYIVPELGKIKIADLTPKMLVDYFFRLANRPSARKNNDGTERKISGRTQLKIYRLLSVVLVSAYKWELIPRNPLEKVTPPKVEKLKATLYSREIASSLIEALAKEDEQFQLIVLMAIFTGEREGEVLGLDWDSYSIAENSFYIHQSSQYTKKLGTYIYPKPKNESSKRTPLLPSVMRPFFEKAKIQFDEIKRVAGDSWNPYNLVFYDEFGNPINPNRISTRFHEFIKKHRLAYMRYHDLRHFNLSLLLANNVPLPTITAHSGHARTSTLLDVYGHAMDQNKQQIPEIIGSELGGFVENSILYPIKTKQSTK